MSEVKGYQNPNETRNKVNNRHPRYHYPGIIILVTTRSDEDVDIPTGVRGDVIHIGLGWGVKRICSLVAIWVNAIAIPSVHRI